jgi:hypothetical protein
MGNYQLGVFSDWTRLGRNFGVGKLAMVHFVVDFVEDSFNDRSIEEGFTTSKP